MDAALSFPLLAGPTVGAAACPKAGVATAAATVNTNRESRHCKFMLSSCFCRVSALGAPDVGIRNCTALIESRHVATIQKHDI
jgi:hypothetical protein